MANYNLEHTGAELDAAISAVQAGYRDVTPVTAQAGDVRKGKVIVTTGGNVTGTWENSSASLQQKTFTENGTFDPDGGYDGFSRVTVNVPQPGGTITITENGTHDVADYASAVVNVASSGGGGGGDSENSIPLPDTITAGDTPVLFIQDSASVTSTSMTASGLKLTVPRAGTYRFTSRAVRYNTSGTTNQGQFYKNGTAVSGTTASFESGKYTTLLQADIQCAAGDTVEVYLKARSSSYPTAAYYLVACIDWNNGFTGTGGSGGSSASLISFTIKDREQVKTTYNAEQGMTWADWQASTYNTGDFKTSDGQYLTLSGKQVRRDYGDYEPVLLTETIEANKAYYVGNT